MKGHSKMTPCNARLTLMTIGEVGGGGRFQSDWSILWLETIREEKTIIIGTWNNTFDALLYFFKPRDQIVQHMIFLLLFSITCCIWLISITSIRHAEKDKQHLQFRKLMSIIFNFLIVAEVNYGKLLWKPLLQMFGMHPHNATTISTETITLLYST